MLEEFRYNMAKRRLQSELAIIVELTEGHESAGVPAGDEIYRLLQVRANKAIIGLQNSAHSLQLPEPSLADIMVGVPKLRKLKQLAYGKKTQATGVLAIGMASVTLVTTLTVAFALEHNLYVWLTTARWFHQ